MPFLYNGDRREDGCEERHERHHARKQEFQVGHIHAGRSRQTERVPETEPQEQPYGERLQYGARNPVRIPSELDQFPAPERRHGIHFHDVFSSGGSPFS